MRTHLHAIAMLVAAAACSRSAPATSTDDASSRNTSINTAPGTNDASQPSASDRSDHSVDRDAAPFTEDAARLVLAAWNDAIDRHDINALGQIYAPRVKYYGREITHQGVVAIKSRALRSLPAFRQSIVGYVMMVKDGDAFTATFVKHSGIPPMRDVKARVVIVDGHIREESDEATDKHAANARGEACESAASNAVASLAAVKKLLDDDRKELEGTTDGRRMGGIGPIANDDGGFSGGFGVHHPDRYEGQIWYTVDRAGKLSVTILGQEVAVPAVASASIERACKGIEASLPEP